MRILIMAMLFAVLLATVSCVVAPYPDTYYPYGTYYYYGRPYGYYYYGHPYYYHHYYPYRY
jgi:hypothetical protein